jgi:oligoribonuclease NrnB/cAMP/cGMP phosphodiesterase (DHH superfamily)
MKEGNSEDGEAETESLEAILGEESASFYRQQVKAAFERVQDEETEKEVVWVSRQLSLSPEQERAVRDVYLRVEQQVQVESAGEGHGSAPKSSQDRVRLMVQEGRLRNSLRQSMLKDVLTPEQYTTYLKNESESASSEMEVFHDPGGH